ncbi:hypothetical protein GIB67_038368 [Kingdonia uniflora]|uniref:RNase H type-1 domain-containing protein n=1 Tax=Kingdonia uniflora TaxID=39325 RepID=A0A7J7NNV1_9MAGN|nr:hypothetical protein GIB67_038368 [Kingdonia uniflora]
MIREPSSNTLHAAAWSYASKSITILELVSDERGLELAKKHDNRKVCIITDSKTVLFYITGKATPNWDAKHLVDRIRNAMMDLEDYQIWYNYRETNGQQQYKQKQ